MALSIVQSTNYNSGASTSATGTIVFTSPPTQGNLLLIGLSYAGPKHPVTPPSGWAGLLDDLENGTSAWLTIYYHVVGVNETNSYVFNTNGGDFLSIGAFEITGQDPTSFIHKHAVATGALTIQTTPLLTPSLEGTLAIAFVAYNDGTTMTSTPATAGAGWTVNQNPIPTFHSLVAASRNSLTTDTVTAINASITWGTTDTNVNATILIAPPIAGKLSSNNLRPRAFAPGIAR